MSANQQAGILPLRVEELPRPVAAFVLGRGRLSLRQALVGCLRELDTEGLVRFETDPGGTSVISLGAGNPRSGRSLLRYEEVALARVRTRASRQARVPLSVLLSDDGDDYKDWARRQIKEIGQEARRAGLARKRLPRHTWGVVLPLIAVAIVAAVVAHGAYPKAGAAPIAPAVAAVLLLLAGPIRLYRWRLTPEGDAAVDSWRRDGGGAPSATQGLGPVGERTYIGLTAPSGAPLPPGHAWSSLGGQWHPVRLGLELRRPTWSTLSGLWTVLGWTAFASFFTVPTGVGVGFGPDGKLIAFAPAALGAFVIVVFWLPFLALRMQVPDDVTFVGEVVRMWHVAGGEYSPAHNWACVDDGSPTSLKFDVPAESYHRLSVGGPARVSWSPRRRCLRTIEPVS